MHSELIDHSHLPAWVDLDTCIYLKRLVAGKATRVQVNVVPAYDPTGKRTLAEATLESDGKWLKFIVWDGDSPEEFEQEVCYMMMHIEKHQPGKF